MPHHGVFLGVILLGGGEVPDIGQEVVDILEGGIP
jgi:hypothetical protein